MENSINIILKPTTITAQGRKISQMKPRRSRLKLFILFIINAIKCTKNIFNAPLSLILFRSKLSTSTVYSYSFFI